MINIVNNKGVDISKLVTITLERISSLLNEDISSMKVSYNFTTNMPQDKGDCANYIPMFDTLAINLSFELIDQMDLKEAKNYFLLLLLHEIRHRMQHRYFKRYLGDSLYMKVFGAGYTNRDTLIERDAVEFSKRYFKYIKTIEEEGGLTDEDNIDFNIGLSDIHKVFNRRELFKLMKEL